VYQSKKDQTMFYLILFFFLGLGMLVQWRLKSKITEYSKIPLRNGMTGRDVAEKMLNDNGIYDVKVISVPGFLSDHYNPLNKTVNLSPDIYNGNSVAAAAIAAHECGHAIQHATAYSWLTLRSKLVPVVQFSSSIVQWVLLGGVLLLNSFPQLLLGGILLFALTTLFSFITLPVEFDASNRALAWLDKTGTLSSSVDHEKAKDGLWWAAMTYVVAALASLATLLYYIMIFMGRRN
jgi:Zn-dependent membrane protease YugP